MLFVKRCPPARVDVEATGRLQWFSRMLAEFGQELLVGDAAKIRAMVVRRQKTDARDARHLLDLLLTDRLPKIWFLTPADNDLRQLLGHRQKLVWMRTSVKNRGPKRAERSCNNWPSIPGPGDVVRNCCSCQDHPVNRSKNSTEWWKRPAKTGRTSGC